MTRTAYPDIEPYDHGWLSVSDGHAIYWEACGNPHGSPALVLHGGPGSGCTPKHRTLFDPARYRIVLLDQRNCGRSTPHAGAPRIDLSANTTRHLIGDIERLRAHLEVETWLLYGASWGSTLGLAYAEQYPQRARAIVLAGVTTTRRSEIDWLYHGLAPLFPAEWAQLCAAAGLDRARATSAEVLASLQRMLHDADAEVRATAARALHAWEWAAMSSDPQAVPPPQWADPAFILARARIVAHYFLNGAWLEEGALLRDAGSLAGIPGVLVQGRLDLGAPMVTAWELAQRWPGSQLIPVSGAGHSTGDPGMREAIVAAIDRLGSV